MKKVFARQGDLEFFRVDDVVEGKKQAEMIVAEGEFTGHHHRLLAGVNAEIVGDRTRFTLTGPAKLVHPEHKQIDFPAGNYIVLTEREYDYAEETLTKVRD